MTGEKLCSSAKTIYNRVRYKYFRQKFSGIYIIFGTLQKLLTVVDSCFGNGTKWISRNESQMWVSGKQRSAMNETTVHYFYRDMKGALFFVYNVRKFFEKYLMNGLALPISYLPTQNVEKILPSKSSVVNSPVISPNARWDWRNSSAKSSLAWA